MAYSELNTITKKINERTLIQLLNDEGRPEDQISFSNPQDPCVERFNQAVADAKAEIDPYLRGRYKLPFLIIPELISSISDNLTLFFIKKRRGILTDDDRKDYDKQVKDLEKIQKGMMDLGVDDEPQNLTGEITTNKKAKDRIFNKEMWDKF